MLLSVLRKQALLIGSNAIGGTWLKNVCTAGAGLLTTRLYCHAQ